MKHRAGLYIIRTRERERESYKATKKQKRTIKKLEKKTKGGKIYMKDSSQNRIKLRDGREDDKQNKKNQQERK